PADSTQADSVQSDSVQADSVQVDSVQVDSTPLDFQLLVKVVGQSYDVGEEITMEFYAFVNGAKKPVPTKELELLYGKFDTPPSNDPEAFGDTVIAYLHGMLNRESFRQNLIGEFLSKVALGQQLNVDSSLNLIVLLLPWDDMRLEAGSKFNVEFASSGVFTQSPPGKMHLRSVYPDGENKHIVCEVCYLFHGNLRVNDCGEAWVEELVSVFKPSACRDLQVYIEHYVQNTNPPMINGRPGP
ncbi:MAG: hypothetical protein OEV80_01965, partial [candidate division Zixibacteria bacterium]|nr:hypothetical protein [candidate division Zixibacteria bacterium]